MKKLVFALLLSAALVFSLTPMGVFATLSGSNSFSIEEEANSGDTVTAIAKTDDVTIYPGYVSVTNSYGSNSAYGIYATAENHHTATVIADDVSLNCSKPGIIYQFGVSAFSGQSEPDEHQGHVNVTTKKITSKGYGVQASAINDSDVTVTVNGAIRANVGGELDGSGVVAASADSGSTKVTVNGNVEAIGLGLEIHAADLVDNKATASVVVNGDVTSTKDAGVLFKRQADRQDVLVTGTVSGNTYGFMNFKENDDTSQNKVTVWKVETGSGKAEDMFVKWKGRDIVADDDLAKAANYIIRNGHGIYVLKPDGSDPDRSHNYRVAREGDRLIIISEDGKEVYKAYNNGEEITTKDEKGRFYYEVPRGGGINITADVGGAPTQKADNPLKLKGKTAIIKYSKLKKKSQTLAVTKAMSFTNDLKDKKTYTLTSAKKGNKSFKKYFKVNATTGKITVKKGLKIGTYKVKVKVRAAGNNDYNPVTKTVTFTVKVRD